MSLSSGKQCLIGALVLCLASSTAAASVSLFPPAYTFDNGTRVALTSNLNWDVNRISDAAPGTGDDDGWRRREIGALIREDGVFDANAFYDIHNKMWLDAALRVET